MTIRDLSLRFTWS